MQKMQSKVWSQRKRISIECNIRGANRESKCYLSEEEISLKEIIRRTRFENSFKFSNLLVISQILVVKFANIINLIV